MTASPWPTELKRTPAKDALTILFEDGARFTLTAEFLRVESPSAEVQGHGPAQKKIVGGKRNVKIEGLEPVGNYAVRIVFDDGHESGLYGWDWLYNLGRNHDRLWQAYLDGLSRQGFSRE